MPGERDKDWRGINVRRNRRYEHVVETLCTRKTESTQKPIFEFNKDLMVFAAMVGYSVNVKEEVSDDSIQIVLQTYATDEKDGYIYLLGLLEKRDVNDLRDANLTNSVGIFEEYCNGGLGIIDRWLSENPQDLDGVDTLSEKILEELSAIDRDDDEPVELAPNF